MVVCGELFAQPMDREKLRSELENMSFNDQFEVANTLMFDKYYAESLFVWEYILKDNPTNANVLYKMDHKWQY